MELLLGGPLEALPSTAPGSLAPVAARTVAGQDVSADVRFRCFGVTPVSDCLGDDLAPARTPEGFVRVTPELRVVGQERVFAIGDVSTADRKMAAIARQQAEVVAGNVRALHAGAGGPAAYERFPAAIAVPLGPEGGAGQSPGQEGIVVAQTVAEAKGRDLMVGGWPRCSAWSPPPRPPDAHSARRDVAERRGPGGRGA